MKHVGRIVAGLFVVLIGLGWLLQAAGVVETLPWAWILPSALIIVGAAMLADAKGDTHGGLIALGIILIIVLALMQPVTSFRWASTGSVGERFERPRTVAEIENMSVFAGELGLDLRDLDLPAGTTKLDVSAFAGKVDITIPDDVTVDVTASVFAGKVTVLDETREGVGVNLEKTIPGPSGKRLELNVSAFSGEIGVHR